MLIETTHEPMIFHHNHINIISTRNHVYTLHRHKIRIIIIKLINFKKKVYIRRNSLEVSVITLKQQLFGLNLATKCERSVVGT